MNDERLGKEIGDFYRETDATPPDSTESAREVAARLSHVDQVKRRRWLPTRLMRSTHQPNPIPAGNGHTPTVIGRTQSMLSPVKAITAGAIIFAIGGAFLIAQPFDQEGGTVPGAEADAEAMAPASVTGTIALGSSCSGPTAPAPQADVEPEREHHSCSTQIWRASDPRLSGSATSTWDADVYVLDEAIYSVVAGTYDLRNESGGWLCHNRGGLSEGMGRFATAVRDEQVTCVGGGAYDGLTAILLLDWSGGTSASVPLEGLIFPGEAPPLPELPAAG